MKSIIFVALLVFIGCKSSSQDGNDKAINTSEITWEPSFQEALNKAKEENKLLFVECYLPTCPVCQAIEPFFKNTNIATKYNSSFINYKLDVGVAEMVKPLNEKNIFLPSFPLFLFFDGEGNLVHVSDAAPDEKVILDIAATALDDTKRASSFAGRFAKGERNIDLLTSYASFSRINRDSLTSVEVAEELFAIFPKEELGTEASWKITKKCVMDLDNGFAKYWFANASKAKEFEIKDGHGGNEANIFGGIIQSSLFSRKGKTYSYAKLGEIRRYMGMANAAQYADNFLWEFETKALIRENRIPEAISVAKRTYTNFSTNGSAIVYVTKVLNDNISGNNHVAESKKWMATALNTVGNDSQRAEYYFESARLFQKAGDNVKAASELKIGMDIAQKAGVDLAKFTALQSSLL